MTDKEEPKEIDVPEPAKVDDTEPPTLSELADAGFDPGELEMAKKHGLAKAEGGKDGGSKNSESGDSSGADAGADGGDAGGDEADKDGSEGDKDGGKRPTKTVDERYRILAEGRSPEAIMEEIQDKGIELSPEQENILIAGLTHNGKTLYWSQKKARLRAQKAEAEASEKSKELEEAKAKIAELEKRPVAKKTDEDDPLNLEGDTKPDADVDPRKKPLTMEDLDRIDAEKAAKSEEEAKKRNGRAQVIHDALDDQQAEARERYEDFDNALTLSGEILKRANDGTLVELYPDRRKQTSMIQKVHTLLYAFANADKFGSEDYNAADMTYDLAKEHPNYGKKKPNAGGSKPGETDVDGNPEDVRRAVNNANRRGSSATLNGGGSRRVALDELTPEQADRLPDKDWRKLPKALREKILSE
jgi:hypothetical protein